MRFVITLILLVLAGCDKESQAEGQAQPASGANSGTRVHGDIALESANGSRATLSYKNVGQKAPTAPFADADGQAVTLADFAGKPLLLNIWASFARNFVQKNVKPKCQAWMRWQSLNRTG